MGAGLGAGGLMTDNPRLIHRSHTPCYTVEGCAADCQRFASTAPTRSYYPGSNPNSRLRATLGMGGHLVPPPGLQPAYQAVITKVASNN